MERVIIVPRYEYLMINQDETRMMIILPPERLIGFINWKK